MHPRHTQEPSYKTSRSIIPPPSAMRSRSRAMGQGYPPTGPSPGANPPIYPSSLPLASGNPLSDILSKSHEFFFLPAEWLLRPCPWLNPVCGVVCSLGFNRPLKRMHTSDLVTTDCVCLVMLIMTQVVRSSSISIITSARIIGSHASTIKTLLSSSSGGSTLTHHGHLWLC